MQGWHARMTDASRQRQYNARARSMCRSAERRRRGRSMISSVADVERDIYSLEMNDAAERRRMEEFAEDHPDQAPIGHVPIDLDPLPEDRPPYSVEAMPSYHPTDVSYTPTSPSYSPSTPRTEGAIRCAETPDGAATIFAPEWFHEQMRAPPYVDRDVPPYEPTSPVYRPIASTYEPVASPVDTAEAREAARRTALAAFPNDLVAQRARREKRRAAESVDTPAKAADSDESADQCLICQDAARTHLCAPCGHLAMCAACADELIINTREGQHRGAPTAATTVCLSSSFVSRSAFRVYELKKNR